MTRARPIRRVLALVSITLAGASAVGGLVEPARAWQGAVSGIYAATAGTWGHPPRIELELRPATLSPTGGKGVVRAELELSRGASASAIDPASVRLCLGTAPCGTEGAVPVAWKLHGSREITFTFTCASVQALLTSVTPPAVVTVTVSGRIGGVGFAAHHRLKVVPASTGTGVVGPPATAPPLAVPPGLAGTHPHRPAVSVPSSLTGVPRADG